MKPVACGTSPNQAAGATVIRLAKRLGIAFCAAVFCAACLDGYPGNYAPVLTPVEMTQSQRLQSMNQIGQQAYLDTRWRYKLTDVCELKVTTGGFFSRESKVILLKQNVVVRSVDRSDKTHDVHMKSLNSAANGLLPLLETANWADAVSLFALATHVQRDCFKSSDS